MKRIIVTILSMLQTNRRILGSTLWLMGDKVIRLGGGLLLSVFLARAYGPADFGTYNYVLAIIGVLGFFISLGFDSLLVKEFLQKNQSTEAILTASLLLRIGGFLAATLALSLYLWLTHRKDETILIYSFIMLGTLFFQVTDIVEFWSQSRMNMHHPVTIRLLSFLATFSVKCYLIFSGKPLMLVFIWTTIELGLVSVGFIWMTLREFGYRFRFDFNQDVFFRLLRLSVPLAVTDFMVIFYMKFSQIYLQNHASSQDVAAFAIALLVSQSWYFIPMSLASALMPSLFEIHRVDPVTFTNQLTRVYGFMFYLACVASIFVTLTGKWLLHHVFGPDYSNALVPMLICIWAGVFVCQGVIFTRWLILESLQRYYLAFVTFGALVNVLLNPLLIDSWGTKGAATAFLITQFSVVYLAPLVFKRTRYNTVLLLKSWNPTHLVRLFFDFHAKSFPQPEKRL